MRESFVPDEADIVRNPEWTLKVRSFAGIVPGASHYQGDLERWCYAPVPDEPEVHFTWREHVDVERKISAAEARRLSTGDFSYQEGWYSDRYFSKAEVAARAIEVFELVRKPGDFLVHDDGEHDFDDLPVLAGEKIDWSSPGGRSRMGAGSPRNVDFDVEELEEGDES